MPRGRAGPGKPVPGLPVPPLAGPRPAVAGSRESDALALIEVRGLTKLYRMGDAVVRALDGVDLTIERGEFVAITGASGSGKSTMMHLLGCLDRPTRGTYRLNNRDVSALSDAELAEVRNKLVGFVFQTFNLINRTTAEENVAVPLFYARRTDTRAPAARALERVGLAARARHMPNELSGGERQRVAIARAIVNDPLLLLADEPTGNLDSRTGEQIMEIFRNLNAQGVTIVLVTHEPDIAAQARRVVHLKDGRILYDRSAHEVAAEFFRPVAVPVARAALPAGDAADAGPLGAASAGAGRPASASPAAGPPAAEPAAAAAPRSRAPGTIAALVSSFVGPALYVGCTTTLYALAQRYDLQNMNPEKLPAVVLTVASVASLGFLLGLVAGAVTILLANGVLRRIREAPEPLAGRRRARAAQVLGWLTVLAPVVLFTLSILGIGR